MLITTTADTSNDAGIAWLKLAIVYLIVGIGIGISMGASHDFTLRPVHAHMNLLGWTTLALAGLVYSIYPQAANSRLAKVHFWLYNLALPPMMLSLAMMMLGQQAAVPVLVASQVVLALAVLVFAANLFINLKPRQV
jgi:cbb3-type cytochrome oxidase subunit 1